jgi:hypothetical protein
MSLPTVEQLRITKGDGFIRDVDLRAFALDVLRGEAERIRQSQDALVKAGELEAWEPGRARAHHGLCAAAAVFERGDFGGAKALREALITEIALHGVGVEIDAVA